MEKSYDVVIVGTGVAGLFCALQFPKNKRICMISKKAADESDSFLAQGGICMLRGEEDYEPYFEDTMRAGHYENNKKTVDLMIRSSNAVIRDLIRYGVSFDRDEEGALAFTKEGAHSQPRILYHKDITGKEITSTLLARAREQENIEIHQYTTMIDLICEDNVCGGIVAADENNQIFTIKANNVVWACGGIGGVYKNSTNFPHLTGDAIAIAKIHGIALEHVNYVQIHPTTLFSKKKGRRFLISESVRGEGAHLLNAAKERFVDELLPRDVVSNAIFAQMEKDGTEHVWEDLRPLGKEEILTHFPNIYNRCLEEGYDCLKEPIPVVPAQHYHMGGVKADLSGRTSMKGLYAVGEAGCNGVHGRNRLASNSLLESLVFSQRAAEDILFGTKNEGCSTSQVDFSKYENLSKLFATYKMIVLEEAEKKEQVSKKDSVKNKDFYFVKKAI